MKNIAPRKPLVNPARVSRIGTPNAERMLLEADAIRAASDYLESKGETYASCLVYELAAIRYARHSELVGQYLQGAGH